MFNNKTKMFLILTLIFVAICGLSAASAADIDNSADDTSGIAADTTQLSEANTAPQTGDTSVQNHVSAKSINKNTDTNVKSEGEGNFTELETDISGSDVKLARDYIQGSEETNITINDNKVIDGDGHTINDLTNGLFSITNTATVTLKNLVVYAGEATNTHVIEVRGNLICDNVTFDMGNSGRASKSIIYAYADANVTITNCNFKNFNTSSGATYMYGARTTLIADGCNYTNISANNNAIKLQSANSNATISNCRFVDNIGANYGGAIYLNNANTKAMVDTCYFKGNAASNSGGAIGSQGNLTVRNSEFYNNKNINKGTYGFGTIMIRNDKAVLYLESNTMDDPDEDGVEIFVYQGKISSPIITGENMIVDQEADATWIFNITDDNGNGISFATNTFGVMINQTRISTTLANGKIIASFTASYEPNIYQVTITYLARNILDYITLPEGLTLTVRDIGLQKYADVQRMIDELPATEDTITLNGPVYRGSAEESIVVNKEITLDLNGNIINAKNGRIFDVQAPLTIKNAIITGVDNANPNNDNVEGRIANCSQASLTATNVTFKDNLAPNFGTTGVGSFFVVGANQELTLDECYITNSSGTFINIQKEATAYVYETTFENNNLYKSYSNSWPALIANGGTLTVQDSEFINNSVNIAVINGVSHTLAMTQDGELTVTNCNFTDNYAASGRGAAINARNDGTITFSKFIGNHQNSMNNGGAIMSEEGDLTIEDCIFVNNYVASDCDGTAICNYEDSLTITRSIIISNVTGVSALYNEAENQGSEVVANGNYWGTNNPEGMYESYEYSDEITVDNWVIFNVTADTFDDEIEYGSTLYVTASLTQLNDGTEITEPLPSYENVTFSSVTGVFKEDSVEMIEGLALTEFVVKGSPFEIKATYPNCDATFTGDAVMPDPEVYVLNDGNWTKYFNEDGTVKDDVVVPNSELRFEGEFNNREMIIAMTLNLTTAETQAVLNNCSFTILSSNTNITKLEMVGNDYEYPLISLEEASNVNIEGNTLTLTNNVDKTVTHTIEVNGGSNNVIRNNTITTIGPDDNIEYASDDSIKTLYTTSIIANSNELLIDDNKITTKKNSGKSEARGTIFGIYVYGDDNDNRISGIQIVNNEINTEDSVFTYGMKVYYADDVLIENNTVTGTSDDFVSGIHVFTISESLINNNTVNTQSKLGYGIVLEGFIKYDWNTPPYVFYLIPEYITVSNNTVNVNSTYAWGIETFGGSNNDIIYNNITVTASEGIGIGLTDEESTVSYNNITVTVTMDGEEPDSYDFVSSYPTGIRLTQSNIKDPADNKITNNRIIVNAPEDTIPAVNVTFVRDNDAVITDNFLVSPLGKGDDAVYLNVSEESEIIVENNMPGPVTLTDETYSEFFNEDGTLKEEYNYYDLIASGDFIENTVFIFDDVEVSFTSDGTAKFYNGQFMTGKGAKVVFDGLEIENAFDAFTLVSAGNIINNTVITINSEEAIQGIYIYDDNNIIANTVLNITAPAANVEYNPDWSVKSPAPAAITISGNNNLVDNVTVFFNGTESIHTETDLDAPTVDGIYLVSSNAPIIGNTIKDTTVTVIGSYYAYGINVGNAKDSTLDNININVTSANYADALQLFDADNITATGELYADGTNMAYGVYSTAMGTGISQNINLTGLNMIVESDGEATGVLVEGSKNVNLAESQYYIKGNTANAIDIRNVEWGGYSPENIQINNIIAFVDSVEESPILNFINASNVVINESGFASRNKSDVVFINTTDVKMTKFAIINGTLMALGTSNLEMDELYIMNTDLQAIYLESSGNTINKAMIMVNSTEPLRVVEIAGDENTISNSMIGAVIPSYDITYVDMVGQPLSSGLYISSNNNVINNVTIGVDGSENAGGDYGGMFATIDAVDIQSKAAGEVLENNVLTNLTVGVTGPIYAYGINVGRAKNTTIENVKIEGEGNYYVAAIQLFDADGISINGQVETLSESIGYGVYSTAMGVGTSKNINLTGLNVMVNAPAATGVLLEGASNATIADAEYVIAGKSAIAVQSYMDWYNNNPSNILITGLDISIETDGDANIMYFGNATNITIIDNHIEANQGSHINFNETPNGVVKDNYILVGDMLETGIFGNYAVITTEDDTIVKNNTPVSKVIDDLNEKIDELTAPKESSIVIDPISNKVNQKINITGAVVGADGVVVANAKVNVTIDGVEQWVTYDGKGTFTVSTKFTTTGDKTIEVNFAGNDNYLESNKTAKVNIVKNDVIITIDDIADVAYGNQAIITGTVTDSEGRLLYNTAIKVTLNGKTITVKTNSKGVFTITTKATTMGENTVNITFAGNNYYNTATETASFNVIKQDVIITFDEIKDVGYGDTAVITGKVTDANGNALINTNIKVTINGKTINVKTDSKGVFTITTKVTKMGEMEVTVNFAGSANFNANSSSTKFNVVKKNVTITVDSFSYKAGNFTVTGKFMDTDGNLLYNSNVQVTINGKKTYAKTNSDGIYVFNGKTSAKEITYFVSFAGNTYYNAYEGTKTTMTFA